MFITDALLGEHAVFYLFLGQIEQVPPTIDSLNALRHRFAAFALDAHASLEDELLFIALGPYLGIQSGPLMVMRFEHDQIIDLLGEIASAAAFDSTQDFARQLFPIVSGHFQKEEQILFQMAGRFLSGDEISTLGGQWQRSEYL